MVICATMTPEMCMPSTAVRLAHELGAAPAGGFDVSAACSGFVYAMNVASSLITTGAAKTIAVVGSETLSKIVNYNDRNTCILFGDGAGAAILTASDDPEQGMLYSSMNSDGEGWELLYCPRNEHDLPENAAEFTGKYETMQMNGREVFKFAVTTLEKTIDDALSAVGIKAKDLAMIVPHQSNVRILRTARDRLDLPEDKMWINIDRYGNTSAASVPICLHEIRQQGKVKPGDLVLFVALGGGLTWASSLWRL
jgi:3-oxoacyl-[acyl-carrier-protein] synthase-3